MRILPTLAVGLWVACGSSDLEGRHGGPFRAYAARTKKLISTVC